MHPPGELALKAKGQLVHDAFHGVFHLVTEVEELAQGDTQRTVLHIQARGFQEIVQVIPAKQTHRCNEQRTRSFQTSAPHRRHPTRAVWYSGIKHASSTTLVVAIWHTCMHHF
jgi:hypothetical protein